MSQKRIGVLALARPTFDVPYAEEVAAAAMATLAGLDAELVGDATLLFDAETTETALEQFSDVELDALLLLQVSFLLLALIVFVQRPRATQAPF